MDTRSAAGRLVLNVRCSVAEWERETIGERTPDALQHLRDEGVRLGGEALGWSRTVTTDEEGRRQWVEVKEEAATVRRILELHGKGASLREIARVLAAEEHRTKRVGQWTHRQVARVLERRRGAVA